MHKKQKAPDVWCSSRRLKLSKNLRYFSVFPFFQRSPPIRLPNTSSVFRIKQPIVLWLPGTPPQLQSRRLAAVGSRPLEPWTETLQCARRKLVFRLVPSGAYSPHARRAHLHFL